MNDPNYLKRSNSLTVRLTRRISNLFRFSSFRKPNPSTKTRTTFYDNDKPVDMTRFSFSSIASTDISNAFMKYEKVFYCFFFLNTVFINLVTRMIESQAQEIHHSVMTSQKSIAKLHENMVLVSRHVFLVDSVILLVKMEWPLMERTYERRMLLLLMRF